MSLLWEKLVRPMLFRLDAERAHEIGLKALENDLAAPFYSNDEFGNVERFGMEFSNLIGIAAGFDKNAVAVNQLASLGFGFVEVGTVTYQPQKGNEKPRMFRLPEARALINRLGFNNDGAEVVASRLRKLKRKCVVGVNIGKNKDVPNEEAVENYLAVFDLVHPVADYVAVNVSSPNTPGLRELQKSENLEELLAALNERNGELTGGNASVNERASTTPDGTLVDTRVSARNKPLLLKIAPDLSKAEIEAVVDICLRHSIAGIIATNTTVSRNGVRTPNAEKYGSGGLSGKPLFDQSNEVISTIYRLSKGKLPIIGVGGIFTAEDAFAKIAAGASLLQVYTGFVYGGPSFPATLNRGLSDLLLANGFAHLDAAVGCDVSIEN